MQKNDVLPRISIVIPVYNEARHLDACLLAVAKQQLTPYEVIVVDNNSTDGTLAIAESYPFVTVLRETRQGVVHARNRGFDAASGDIIGRLDADTILPANWTECVAKIFDNQAVDAVSGSVTYYDLPYTRLTSMIDLFFRQTIAHGMGEEVFLYGANMAIRRLAWLDARSAMCQDGGLHEDFDLAIHAEETGARVVFDSRLQAAVSLRRVDVSWRDFLEYVLINPRTYARHGRTSQRHMYPALGLVASFYWLIKLMHRGYDAKLMCFSWRKLLSPVENIRPNPATFVD